MRRTRARGSAANYALARATDRRASRFPSASMSSSAARRVHRDVGAGASRSTSLDACPRGARSRRALRGCIRLRRRASVLRAARPWRGTRRSRSASRSTIMPTQPRCWRMHGHRHADRAALQPARCAQRGEACRTRGREGVQFRVWSTSLFFLIHGIIARSFSPTTSRSSARPSGGGATCSVGAPARFSRMKSLRVLAGLDARRASPSSPSWSPA